MTKKGILIALGLALSGSTFAADSFSRGYIGVGYGSTKSTVTSSSFTQPDICNIAGQVCTTDDEDSSKQLYAGYNFTPRFSLEAAYTDLGITASVTDGDVSGKQTTKGLSVSLLGKIPLSHRISVYGKAGLYRWDSRSQVSVSQFSFAPAQNKGNDATVGVGLEYKMNRRASARLSWDRYNNVGKNAVFRDLSGDHTVGVDVDVVSVGLQYNFQLSNKNG